MHEVRKALLVMNDEYLRAAPAEFPWETIAQQTLMEFGVGPEPRRNPGRAVRLMVKRLKAMGFTHFELKVVPPCPLCGGEGVVETLTRYGTAMVEDSMPCPRCAAPPTSDEPPF